MEKIKYSEQRGKSRVLVGLKNREKVREWFLKNNNSTQRACCESTGLSKLTVSQHLKAILNEGKE